MTLKEAVESGKLFKHKQWVEPKAVYGITLDGKRAHKFDSVDGLVNSEDHEETKFHPMYHQIIDDNWETV